MEQKHQQLIHVIRSAASGLRLDSAEYQWGHMGQCNVGHLMQAMTGMKSSEIVRSVDHEMNEWTEFAKNICEETSHKVEDLFASLHKLGFSREDVIHLENLTDKHVLENLPGGFRHLRRNDKNDVIAYFESMADLLAKAA